MEINKIENMEHQLEELIEHIRLLEIMVCDFQPQSQNNLNHQLNSIIKSLQDLQKSKAIIYDIQIPLDLIEYVDKGLTPEIYIKDYMDKCLFKNEEAKNRVESLKKFKDTLMTEINKVFPTETTKYCILRSEDTTFQP
ncbi:unnamed protein product [Gordionus sp. m RMFG-2023]